MTSPSAAAPLAPRYRSQQHLFVVARVAVVIAAAAAWALLLPPLVGMQHVEGAPPRWLAIALLVVIGIVLPILGLRFAIVVEVDDDHLRWRIAPFPFRTVPLHAVRHASTVAFRPMLDYGGWGVRWTPWAGWAFTARGSRGVAVELADDQKKPRRFVLGCDDPDALVAALAAAGVDVDVSAR